MQSPPNDTSRGYMHHRQTLLSSPCSPNYMDHAARPLGYHPVVQTAQVQIPYYGHPQDHHHPAVAAGNTASMQSLPMTRQSGSSVNAQYPPRHYPPDTHHTRALFNAGVLVEQGQLTVPPQHQAHYFTQQKHFINPAVQTQIENPAYTKLADGVSGQSHRYAPVDAILNFKVSPTVTAERRYFCSCGKDYSQPQGVLRHRRAAHIKPHSCFSLHCRFKWTRPCEYRAHLGKQHPKVNPDKVLGKPAGDRCRSTIIGRDLVSSQTLAASNDVTLPALAKVTHIPSPAISPVAYDPEPEYAEPTVTTRKHEDARGLEFLGAVDASAFSST